MSRRRTRAGGVHPEHANVLMCARRVACSTSPDLAVGAVAVLVLLVVLSLLARLDIKRLPAASAEVPAPLAIGTELQVPRPSRRCR